MYLSLILLIYRDGNNGEASCYALRVSFPSKEGLKGHIQSPDPSLSAVYFFSHNRFMRGIIMRELFGPVSTNVNWYNGRARRYKNNKKEQEERGC